MKPRFISGRRQDDLLRLMVGVGVSGCITIVMKCGTIGNVKRVVSGRAFPRSTQGGQLGILNVTPRIHRWRVFMGM